MHHYYQTFHQANFIVNDVSDVPVFTRARTLLPVNYLYLEESLANNGGGGAGRLAVFTRKSIPLKTQTGLIKGVITSFKNELFFVADRLQRQELPAHFHFAGGAAES